METVTGGCQCGRIRYEVTIEDHGAYLCHCRMCQRATGGVAAALKSVKRAKLRWLSEEPDWYDSSPIAHRPFCASCGSPLGYAFREASDKLDLTVGSFDDPGRFKPVLHFGAESLHEAWIDTSELKRIRTEEYQVVVDKWVRATGTMPE